MILSTHRDAPIEVTAAVIWKDDRVLPNVMQGILPASGNFPEGK